MNDLEKPWCGKQVTRYLKDIQAWIKGGYKLTEEQVERMKTILGDVQDDQAQLL